uniref:Cuticle protein n=1 Tax=Anopheles stephensi TaxID=30069 RepID=A0A182Y5H3_ANOST
MKCIAAVVMMALAVAQGAVLPVPVVYSAPETTVVQQNVAPKYVTSNVAYAAPTVTTYSVPQTTYVQQKYISAAPAVAYAAPAVTTYNVRPSTYTTVEQNVAPAVAYSAPVVTAYSSEARYVAATPGAVHDAPLVGHTVNQKAFNVEPAPGTQ